MKTLIDELEKIEPKRRYTTIWKVDVIDRDTYEKVLKVARELAKVADFVHGQMWLSDKSTGNFDVQKNLTILKKSEQDCLKILEK